MPEHGLKISNQEKGSAAGRTLFVYFTPMSYFDWLYSSTVELMYDPAFIRNLFTTYITRIIVETGDNRSELPVLDLMYEDDTVKMTVIDSMIEKAGFNSEEKLLGMVRKCRDKSNTLAGTYDTFVMVNTDFSFYVQFLNSDIYTRSQIISSLEKMKQFTVEERYKDAMEGKFDVNLMHGPEEYRMWKAQQEKKQIFAEQSRANKPVKPEVKEVLTEDLNSIIEQSKDALNEAMRKTKKMPVKYFDWEKDEKDFSE